MKVTIPESKYQEILDRIDSLPISDIINDTESLVDLHILLARANEKQWDREILAMHAYVLGLQRAQKATTNTK